MWSYIIGVPRHDPKRRRVVEKALRVAEHDYELVVNDIRNRETSLASLRERAAFLRSLIIEYQSILDQ